MIAERTGWSYESILHEVSFVNLQMMLHDAPTVKRVKKTTPKLSGEAAARQLKLIK